MDVSCTYSTRQSCTVLPRIRYSSFKMSGWSQGWVLWATWLADGLMGQILFIRLPTSLAFHPKPLQPKKWVPWFLFSGIKHEQLLISMCQNPGQAQRQWSQLMLWDIYKRGFAVNSVTLIPKFPEELSCVCVCVWERVPKAAPLTNGGGSWEY